MSVLKRLLATKVCIPSWTIEFLLYTYVAMAASSRKRKKTENGAKGEEPSAKRTCGSSETVYVIFVVLPFFAVGLMSACQL